MKNAKNYMIAALGILLLLSGKFLMEAGDSPLVFMRALPYVCIGIGSGVLGYGISNIVQNKILQAHPAMQKQMEINSKDERNLAISNRAKAKAYDFMIFMFAALMLGFVLMGVDMIPVLFFVFTYLFVQGYAIYYRCRYEKEM